MKLLQDVFERVTDKSGDSITHHPKVHRGLIAPQTSPYFEGVRHSHIGESLGG